MYIIQTCLLYNIKNSLSMVISDELKGDTRASLNKRTDLCFSIRIYNITCDYEIFIQYKVILPRSSFKKAISIILV